MPNHCCNMRQHLVLLPLIFLFMIGIMSSFPSSTVVGTSSGGATMPTPQNDNASNIQPTVIFPTPEQVKAYNMELGSNITAISNSSQGDASDVKAVSKGNETFVVWLGKIDGINHVFFSVTRDKGAHYTPPLELSPPSIGNASSGNASNLQLAVYDSIVDVAWQSTDLTSGNSSIIGSASMNNSLQFKTYKISPEGTNATDPVLAGNFIILWTQQDPPCPPHCDTVYARFRW